MCLDVLYIKRIHIFYGDYNIHQNIQGTAVNKEQKSPQKFALQKTLLRDASEKE